MRILFIIAILLTLPVKAKEPPVPPGEKAPQMISVDLKLVEISRTKMQQLGVELTTIDGTDVLRFEAEQVFDDIPTSAISGFIEAVTKNKVGRILAHPRIVTLSGKEASLAVNSSVNPDQVNNIASTDGTIHVGTNVEVLPVSSASEITLHLRMQWCGLRGVGQQSPQQHLWRYEVDTSVVAESGKSVPIIGQECECHIDGAEAEEVFLLCVITPQLIERTAEAAQRTAK